MGKYDPLHIFLDDLAPDKREITLTFTRIEDILGDKLPYSARHHRAWWSNQTSSKSHPEAQSWLTAGWRVDTVNQQEEWVRFRR